MDRLDLVEKEKLCLHSFLVELAKVFQCHSLRPISVRTKQSLNYVGVASWKHVVCVDNSKLQPIYTADDRVGDQITCWLRDILVSALINSCERFFCDFYHFEQRSHEIFCYVHSVFSQGLINFHLKSHLSFFPNKFHICNAQKLFHEYIQMFFHKTLLYSFNRDPTLGARATIFSMIKRRLSVCYVFRAKEMRFFVDDESSLHIV